MAASAAVDIHTIRYSLPDPFRTRSRPKCTTDPWREGHQASRLQRGISAYATQPLFFVLLPKLDVVGSSPIALSTYMIVAQRIASGCRLTKRSPLAFFGGSEQVPTGPEDIGDDTQRTRWA